MHKVTPTPTTGETDQEKTEILCSTPNHDHYLLTQSWPLMQRLVSFWLWSGRLTGQAYLQEINLL